MRHCFSRSLVWGLMAVFAFAGSRPVVAQQITDEQVGQAIDKAVDYIYGQVNPWGHWDIDQMKGKLPAGNEHSPHEEVQLTGWTSLAVYALLSAGEEWQQNPKLEKPLKFLAEAETFGIYAIGMRAHVWPKLPDQGGDIKFLQELREDQYALENAINQHGGYRYHVNSTNIDLSCSQYGFLGMWEASKRGLAPGRNYWMAAQNYVTGWQNADGGWGYTDGRDSNLQMTAAGLAVLFITLDYAHASDFARPGVAANHPTLRRINRGLEWMDENYKPSTNGYNMVGVERVALASGRKYFNNEDWYRTGAKAFIDKMNDNGQIGGGGHGGNIVNTAFALVFLSRGRVPVFVNKLEIDGYAWNNRPQDMAKLTAWASDELEIPMNWQIIDFRHDPSEWMDAPFLYLSGHTPLALNEDQLAKLRKYINLGGTLVTTADGNSQEFTNSVIETFQQMYADDGLKFSQVAADDPLMSLHYPVRNMEVLSLHNGIRHMVIHVPRGDIGWTFQSGNEREATPWNFMANVFQYSIEKKKPKNRLESYYVAGEGGGKTVHVGQARYDGKWNPEPLGWERFGDLSTAVDPVPHSVDLSAIGDADVSMVHVAGSEAVNFSADQIAAMREYVDGGGVIVFEAVGGSEPYFSAVRKMLVEAFPGKQLGKLSRHSDVITGTGGGTNASKVNYRLFYTQTLGFADDSPSLLAMEFDGQPRIIVSPDDLTGGMMGLEKWGIFGYEPESAQKLMGNIALWASRINPASGAIEAPVEEAAAE